MRTYEKYKDSGISWIGKVPDDWDVCKFKYTINIRNGKDYKDVQSDSNNDYPVYGSGGIFAYAQKYLYDGEALLLGRKGTIDKPIYIKKGKFWTVDTMFYGLATNGNVCKYLYYQALTFPFGRYATSTALPSMTQSDLGNNPICLPSIPEQEAIANYLDKKTAEIDKIIAEREKKIELLNELKSSIISRAVTKGINPHAKMKNSGIDWIGEIPNHWQIRKSTLVFNNFGSGTTPKAGDKRYRENGDIPWLNTGDLNDGLIQRIPNKVNHLAIETYPALKIYPEGSLVVAMYGATIGKLGILTTPCCTNQACCVILPTKHANMYYYKYVFMTMKDNLIIHSNGGGQPNISQDIIRNSKLPYPPIEEQKSIAEYLDKKSNELDSAIATIKEECILYKEYKQSLISEVVTGKRKVVD